MKKLTEAERKRYREQGLCFKCRKPGHIARQCPTRGQGGVKARLAYQDAEETSEIQDPVGDIARLALSLKPEQYEEAKGLFTPKEPEDF